MAVYYGKSQLSFRIDGAWSTAGTVSNAEMQRVKAETEENAVVPTHATIELKIGPEDERRLLMFAAELQMQAFPGNVFRSLLGEAIRSCVHRRN